jgi:hypothetical protein
LGDAFLREIDGVGTDAVGDDEEPPTDALDNRMMPQAER